MRIVACEDGLVVSRYRDPRSKRRRRPFTWRTRVVLAAFPAALGALVIWRGIIDPARTDDSDSIVVPLLLALCLAGVLACFGSESRRGRWFARAGTFLGTGAITAFFGYLVIGGLFAPDLVADPSSTRAPRTEFGATLLAVLLLAGVVGVFVTTALEKRKRRRRS